ncbi:Lymphocyte activation gene 3 protein [Microtus ochrogaster]|uniref:Lymphocyte activation gene 3 protein n=1 Tax=Microtus ochrogaster TaxID=79684 RepID=A0A8J6H261_MICOH|nr:Lymphocyte activation gene 3 protein [Microtus ochrogaster]
MRETLLLGLLLLRLLWAAPAVVSEPGREDSVVWAQEGAPVHLPCSPQLPHRNPDLLRRGVVTWQHQPDGSAPHRYTVLSVAPGGLRSGRLPLQSRVQLDERRLQRGDFSLWLRPARRADAGEYHAVVRFPDRTLFCRLRLRVGQASSLEPLAPLTVYAAAGSRVELPCHLPQAMGTSSSLTAKWTPPGGGSERLVAGKSGSFALRLETVGLEQAGTYTCSVHLQGRQLSAVVTLAVITGARSARRASGDLKGDHLFLLLILSTFSLFLVVTGAFGFHLWRRQWLRRRFSALENRIPPPPSLSKTEELERDLEIEIEMEQEPEPEPEPELEQEPQPEPEPRQQ